MDDMFKVMDDVAFGARMVKKPIHMQFFKSGVSIWWIILLLAVALVVLLVLFMWPCSQQR